MKNNNNNNNNVRVRGVNGPSNCTTHNFLHYRTNHNTTNHNNKYMLTNIP